MKRITVLFVFLFSMMLFSVSCGKQEEVPETPFAQHKNSSGQVFHAITESHSLPESKVYADESMKVLWNKDDRITVFNRNTNNREYKFIGEDGENQGSFQEVAANGGATGNSLSHTYAVYPYSSDNQINNAGTALTVFLPSEQSYRERSFGLGANVMTAVTDNDFMAFKNVCGYLSLRFYGNDISVSRITLKGNSNEKIAGKASIAVSATTLPAVTMDETATDAITLVCDPPVQIGSTAENYTDFWFAIPPITFSKGFTVTLTDPVGGTYEKSTAKSFTVTRSRIDWMNPLSVGPMTYMPLTLDPENIAIPATAENGTFEIKVGGSWSITLPSPKPDWLTSVSPVSGAGNATIKVETGNYTERTKAQTFLTVQSGSTIKYLTITKEAVANAAPTKPTGLTPSGNGVETITTFSWNASTDANGDNVKYTVMLSKDNINWTAFDATDKTSVMNKNELEKNTTYYYKVVADDGYDGGKTESDVITFTTGSTKSHWADGEVKLYEINSDGSITEVSSTSRPFKLIYTGDGYTQDLYNYGGQFDQEINAGITALFEVEPYKHYYSYFAVYKVAAYSNEAGMSSGSTKWEDATNKVDTKFRCSWAGGNSTSINCNTDMVIEYASKCPGYKGSNIYETRINLSWSPISIIINADQYAGTNIWSTTYEMGMKMLSIAQTPARHPSYSSYGGFAYTLRHEYGGHGIGLLGDEYVYYNTTPYPQGNESSFRYWQNIGAYSNIYLPEWDSDNSMWFSDPDHCSTSLTPTVEGANWKTFADMNDYAGCNIRLHAGASMYGQGIYRSENNSCMINNVPHFNTFSRWKIYCRIKITAGETPTVEDFLANDVDKINNYGSAAPSTKSVAPDNRRCEGPILMDEYHSKPYRLQ